MVQTKFYSSYRQDLWLRSWKSPFLARPRNQDIMGNWSDHCEESAEHRSHKTKYHHLRKHTARSKLRLAGEPSLQNFLLNGPSCLRISYFNLQIAEGTLMERRVNLRLQRDVLLPGLIIPASMYLDTRAASVCGQTHLHATVPVDAVRTSSWSFGICHDECTNDTDWCQMNVRLFLVEVIPLC